MTCYSIEPGIKNIFKDTDSCHSRVKFLTNVKRNYWILLQKQEYMLLKTIIHKVAEATGF